jgi:2,5-diketo-D-gluconate reductase A
MTNPLPLSPTIRLANGVPMPQIGLGTWPMKDAEAATAVRSALQQGYRLVDTAENYGNETGVGEGLRSAGVPRAELFVTSKFNRNWHSVDGVRQAAEASLKRLGLDYLDLFLIHWPNPEQDRYVEAFEGLMRLVESGLVRAAGTSNFKTTHLQRLLDAGFVPHLNQIQLDPYHRRDDILALHRAHGIATGSWGPIGRGRSGLLADPVVQAIARAHGRDPAQIALRWHVQSGHVAIPKSIDPARQAVNLQVFDFALSEADMAQLNGLDRPDPAMLDADSFGH